MAVKSDATKSFVLGSIQGLGHITCDRIDTVAVTCKAFLFHVLDQVVALDFKTRFLSLTVVLAHGVEPCHAKPGDPVRSCSDCLGCACSDPQFLS